MQAAGAREPPGEQRRAPRVEIGLARELRVERLERLRGSKEQRRGLAAAALGVRGLGAQQVQAGALQLVERPDLGRRQQPARRVERAGLQARLGGGERAVGPPRRVAGQRDGALQERGRRGEAAARLRPPGRALELQGDLLVGSRGAPRPDATRGGPGRRPGRSPPPAPGGPPGAPRRPPTGTPPSAPADGGTSRARRSPAARPPPRRPRPPGRCRAARPRASSRSGSPIGSAAATSSRTPRVLGERLEPADEALLDPSRKRCPPPAARTRRPAPSPSSPRGSSSSASGLPRVSAMIRSRTRSSSMNRTAEPSSARASPLRRPCTSSSGTCRSSSPGSRAANTIPTGSASSRRATKRQRQRRGLIEPLRVVDDAQQRTLLGHLREQARAPPARRGTDPAAAPALRPNTISSAWRCGAGSRSSRSSIGAHSWCRPANASSISDSTPTARATRQVRRRLDQVLEQRRLPDPGLAPQDQRPALALADVREQRVQHRALVGPPPQARCGTGSEKGVAIRHGRS